MKTSILIIVILVLVGLGIAGTMKNPSTTKVVVLQDITDEYLTRPNADEILSLYNLDDKWNGAMLSFSDITDVSYNKTTEANLEGRNDWMSNELDRDKEIEKFKTDVKTIITKAGKVEAGKEHSSIYLPIARELNQLSHAKSQKKILIVYSDLMENTQDVSFYTPKDLLLLNQSPGLIQKEFEKQIVLDSLSGIEVYFIFQPLGEISDQDFGKISKFYQRLLESKGAKVTISANINL